MSERKLVPIIFAAAIGTVAAFTSVASADALWPPRPGMSANEAMRAQYRQQYRQQSPGAPGYLNGHRGYRHYHPGYRRHGNYWFPPAAFALGAIVGGAIATSPGYDGYYGPRYYERRVVPSYNNGSAHVRWCYNRYRSYRASDNTFQPYHGPRQQCWSPYS